MSERTDVATDNEAPTVEPQASPEPQPVPSQERPEWITTVEKAEEPGGEKRSD